jgi:hypothetical protein
VLLTDRKPVKPRLPPNFRDVTAQHTGKRNLNTSRRR